jgi:serine/threonine protein kinase
MCLLTSHVLHQFFALSINRPGFACLPRGDLTYIAPEVLRSMSVVPPLLVALEPYTFETDVYAFG